MSDPRGCLTRRATLYGLSVLLIGCVAVLGLACRSVPLPPSLGSAQPDLERSAASAVADEGPGIRNFLDLFADFDPEALATSARSVYAEDALFNDGFVALEGSEAIAEYLERSAGAVDSFEFTVYTVARVGVETYLHWEMTYVVNDTTITAPGISHLRFNDAGKAVYHRDYWDASGAIAIFVPPAAAVLRAVRNRL
jgi:hypothetical protein